MSRAVIIFFCAFKTVTAIYGVIWDKNKQDFVPIESVYNISINNQSHRSYIFNRIRELETHNFQKYPLTIGFSQVNDNFGENY